MKITIDTKVDSKNEALNIINVAYDNKLNNNEGQQSLATCEKCGKSVDQKVVNYCKIQFDGHIYCRDCQKTLGGASP